MEKVKITKIFRTDTDRNTGQPLVGANGKKYERLGIKTQQHGEVWLSGFGGFSNKNWKEGDEVEIEIKRVTKDGKEYLNFSSPSAMDLLTKRVEALERLLPLSGGQSKVCSAGAQSSLNKVDYPSDEINPDEIPF